jgi:hypothetical protein
VGLRGANGKERLEQLSRLLDLVAAVESEHGSTAGAVAG